MDPRASVLIRVVALIAVATLAVHVGVSSPSVHHPADGTPAAIIAADADHPVVSHCGDAGVCGTSDRPVLLPALALALITSVLGGLRGQEPSIPRAAPPGTVARPPRTPVDARVVLRS